MSVLCCETIFSIHWFYIAHASSDKMRQHKMLTEGHHWLHILLPQNIAAADTYIILIYKFLYADTDSENYMFYQTVFKTH